MPSRRSRIRTNSPTVTGGGGGPPGGGVVAWGPDFGSDPGSDGETSNMTLDSDIQALALSGGSDVSLDTAVTNLALSGGSDMSMDTDLENLAISGGSDLSMTGGDLTFQTGQTIASKDTWVGSSAACAVDNVNHNGEDLSVANLTRESLIAWDLSGLQSNVTVTAGTFRIERVNASLGNVTLSIFKITNAAEAWNEATVKCDDRPAADGAAMQTWNIGTTAGAKSLALNSTVLTRIQARMGVGFVTFLIQSDTATATTIEATDQGANDNLGPRLELTFTKTP